MNVLYYTIKDYKTLCDDRLPLLNKDLYDTLPFLHMFHFNPRIVLISSTILFFLHQMNYFVHPSIGT